MCVIGETNLGIDNLGLVLCLFNNQKISTFQKPLIFILGCPAPTINSPLMISQILSVYPPGTFTLSCAASFTIEGNTIATCSGTTLMFDPITTTCLPSKIWCHLLSLIKRKLCNNFIDAFEQNIKKYSATEK